MSRPSTRRHRRAAHTETPTPDEGAPAMPANLQETPVVQLDDPESADFLRWRLDTMAGKAREAYERAQAAKTRAGGHEQTVAKLDTAKKDVLARLDQIEREMEAATNSAVEARAEHDHHMAEHNTFVRRAQDASRLCQAAGISTDSGLPVPPTGPMPVPPVDPTADDPRLDGPMGRFNDAHDTDPAGEQAGAA